jgi:hypothetical protein
MELECSSPCPQEPATVPILSQMKPVHTFQSCFPKINSNIILPSGAGVAQWYSAGLLVGWLGVRVSAEAAKIFFSPPSPDWLWGPPSFLSSEY